MNILVLSPYPDKLLPAFEATGDTPVVMSKVNVNELSGFLLEPDLVVSYGYRWILKKPFLERYRCINLHISLLPWNRGADPNFWSWYDDTPKGVTIHEIDGGVDTGPILAQRRIFWSKTELDTLASTYDGLQDSITRMFRDRWRKIRNGGLIGEKQSPQGSTNMRADLARIWTQFPKRWDTPVSEVEEAGRRARDAS